MTGIDWTKTVQFTMHFTFEPDDPLTAGLRSACEETDAEPATIVLVMVLIPVAFPRLS